MTNKCTAVALLSGVAICCLSGCSPGLDPILGVQLTKAGMLRLHVEACQGDVADQYSLHGAVEETKKYSQAWVATNSEPKTSLRYVSAFSNPKGWSISREGDQLLKKKYSYYADVEVIGRDGGLKKGRVHFSLQDVKNVPHDKFLVGLDDGNRVMTRKEFKNIARKDCG